MDIKIKEFANQYKNKKIPAIKAGDTVRVYQKYQDKGKEKTQMFEGLVICRKHGGEMGAAITVRKVASGVGIEKIFPIHSPIIDRIEIVKSGKVRRAKIYYIRDAKGRKARLKRVERNLGTEPEEAADQTTEEEPKAETEAQATAEESQSEPKAKTEEKTKNQEA